MPKGTGVYTGQLVGPPKNICLLTPITGYIVGVESIQELAKNHLHKKVDLRRTSRADLYVSHVIARNITNTAQRYNNMTERILGALCQQGLIPQGDYIVDLTGKGWKQTE